MKHLISFVLAFLLAGVVPSHAEKIKVIASIAPLADFARQVGGEKVDVRLLLPPGASPHTYEPTPRAIQDISDARAFIKIGAGLEFWSEKIIKAAANRTLIIVDSSEGVSLLRDPHSHGHRSADPHIWLDPVIAGDIIIKIENAFIRADPRNAEHYRLNALQYREKLSELDADISRRVKKLKTKEYVTFHPAWNYFSKRYGLRVAAVIEESPGKEPSAKHMQKIINKINAIGKKVVFVEPQFNPKIAEVIAKESGAKVVYLDPIGGQKGRETYLDMMKYNIAAIAKAME